MTMMPRRPGRSFYAAPGPTNVPDTVLQAVAQASVDFMGADFSATYEACVGGLQRVLATAAPIYFLGASGHGAWEAAFANLFAPGDCVLMLESGVFSGFWTGIGTRLGLQVETVAADWRRGVAVADVEAALRADTAHRLRAVCVVHNDTASGVALPVAALRAALDRARHPALLLLDTISSVGSLPMRMDEWRVDVAVGGSQKGLMMLPGLSFCAVSQAALAVHRAAARPGSYFDWSRMDNRAHRHSSGTISAGMFAGLRQALALLEAEGVTAAIARHRRLAGAVRAAIAAWDGPELFCLDPARESDSVSTVLLAPGQSAAAVRRVALERFNVVLGGDLGFFEDRMFRIGHMGDLNEAMVLGVLGVVELSLTRTGVPHRSGIGAALAALAA